MSSSATAKIDLTADNSMSCRGSRADFRFVPFSASFNRGTPWKGRFMLTETQKDTLRGCHSQTLKYLHKEIGYEEFQNPLEDIQLFILELLLDHEVSGKDGKILDLAYKLANEMGQQDPADRARSVHTLADYLEQALGIV